MVMILIEAAKQSFKFKQLAFHWVLHYVAMKVETRILPYNKT